MDPEGTCIALICDQQGNLEKIIRDDLELLESTTDIKRFPELLSSESRQKAERFLATLRKEMALSGWELVIDLRGRLKTMYFAGGAVGKRLLIVGSLIPENMDEMFEDMMRISNKQTNRIRSQSKQIAEKQPSQEEEIYDELSRLNNELITAQRELAQKNVELEDLYSSEKQRTRELNAIYQATSALLSTLDLNRLLKTILDAALQALPQAGKGLLLLREDDHTIWNIKAAVGWDVVPDPDVLTSPLSEPMEKAAQKKEFMIVKEKFQVNANSNGNNPWEIIEEGPILLGPLYLNKALIGFLVLSTPNSEVIQDMDLKLWEAFGATATAAIHNAQLHQKVQQLALTDPLTGLHNRRGFTVLASQQIKQAQRYKAPLVVMMIDLDHFKQVNDQYGHQAGDQVLVEVTRRMRSTLRESDILGRYGGEEFVVLLPDTDHKEGKQIGKRLLETVRDRPIDTHQGQIPLTISIGMTVYDEWEASLKTMLEKSDAALYRAKEAGRDQIQY